MKQQKNTCRAIAAEGLSIPAVEAATVEAAIEGSPDELPTLRPAPFKPPPTPPGPSEEVGWTNT